jgi:hypothetical protein
MMNLLPIDTTWCRECKEYLVGMICPKCGGMTSLFALEAKDYKVIIEPRGLFFERRQTPPRLAGG